jgi:tRNA threonylcarbamoyl adenosine modification protein YjeE
MANISHSPVDTIALGERWGRAAQSGLVIGLSGDLGAGKTQFVKGLAAGLGITARVHSPTFALINIYDGGRLTLFHVDLYRLDTPQQIAAAGLEEYLTGVMRSSGRTMVRRSLKVGRAVPCAPRKQANLPRFQGGAQGTARPTWPGSRSTCSAKRSGASPMTILALEFPAQADSLNAR